MTKGRKAQRRANLSSNMATKNTKSQLLKPSEFSKKIGSGRKIKGDAGSNENWDKQSKVSELIPPSMYAVKKMEDELRPAHKAAQFTKGQTEKRAVKISKTAASSGYDNTKILEYKTTRSDDIQIEDTTKKLLMEIKSCKEENRKMHKELTTQLQPFVGNTPDSMQSSIQHKKLQDVLLQVQENHDRNSQFHELLQVKVQKQADSVERMMQQFLDHQSELNSENEKLRRKLSRMNEEHRDIKMHLERQVEMKERQCHDYAMKLQAAESELASTITKNKREVNSLVTELRDKEIDLADLQSTATSREKSLHHLQANQEIEFRSMHASYAEEIESLKKIIFNYENDLQQEKKEKCANETLFKQKEVTFKNDLHIKNVEITDIQEKMKEKETKIIKLTEELKFEKENNKMETEELKSDMERKLAICQEELKAIILEQNNTIDKEKQNFDILKAKFEKTAEKLESAEAEIKHFHAYIAEKEAEKEAETDTRGLELKVKALEEERTQLKDASTNLESTAKFLNVRIQSLNNIVKIQEAELSKVVTHPNTEKQSDIITKWRDKVYSLLIRLKTHEIGENENMIKLQNQVKDYQRQIKEQNSKVTLLDNQLEDKRAHADMQENQIKTLLKEVSALQEKLKKHEQQDKEFEMCMEKVKTSVIDTEDTFSKKCAEVDHSLVALRTMENRIKFAHKRLEIIKDLFNRKETMLTSRLEMFQDHDQEGDVDKEISEHDKRSLLAEVEQLTNERTLLMNQIKMDAEKMSILEKSIRDEYEAKIKTKNDHLENLEGELENVKCENNKVKARVSELEKEHSEQSDEIEKLKFDMMRINSEAQKEFERKLEQERLNHMEESSKMEQIINETKREHAKAVISLQQIERQLNWNKQNNEDILKANNAEHEHEISKLKKSNQELEKERNVLLTTIKQENIKMPRLRPVELGTFLEEEANPVEKPVRIKRKSVQQKTEEGKRKSVKAKMSGKENAKLSNMLKELQSISASLLQEEPATGTVMLQNENNGGTSGEL